VRSLTGVFFLALEGILDITKKRLAKVKDTYFYCYSCDDIYHKAKIIVVQNSGKKVCPYCDSFYLIIDGPTVIPVTSAVEDGSIDVVESKATQP
jgi:uncharacterized Zn-finger protein